MYRIVIGILCAGLLAGGLTMGQRRGRGNRPPVKWVNSDIPKMKGLSHHVLASKAMGQDVGYVVWLPPQYEQKADERFPVVYFLHGAGGNESKDAAGFSGKVAAAIKSGAMPPAICVFPNGGMTGYRGNMEKLIIDELIPLIDKDYRTIAQRSGRVLCGFSMGGGGSMRLALLHPDRFAGAGAWAGSVGNRDKELYEGAAKVAKLPAADRPKLLLIVGDKDMLYQANQQLFAALKKIKIDFDSNVLEGYSHNLGKYYEATTDEMMKFLGSVLRGKAADAATQPAK